MYRESGGGREPRPIELDTRIIAFDFTDGPSGPFSARQTATAVSEAASPGLRLRGAGPASWTHSVQLDDYQLQDFGLRVMCRLEKESNAQLRIWFRHFNVQAVQVGYSFTARPRLRQYRAARYAGTESMAIVEWSSTPHILGTTEQNVFEIAVQTDRILIGCNDEVLTLLQDASFGRGAITIGGIGSSVQDALILDAVELWTVRAG